MYMYGMVQDPPISKRGAERDGKNGGGVGHILFRPHFVYRLLRYTGCPAFETREMVTSHPRLYDMYTSNLLYEPLTLSGNRL